MDPQPHHCHQRETTGERAFSTSYLLTSSLYRYQHYRLKRWLVYALSLDSSMFKSSVMFCHPVSADPTLPFNSHSPTHSSTMLTTPMTPSTTRSESIPLTMD